MIPYTAASRQIKRSSPSGFRSIWLVLGTLTLISAVAPTSAEQLATPVTQQGGDRKMADMPDHAQKQSAVRARFGEPQMVKGPVGEPPITQWHYADFVVYFEYDHVIHAVTKPDQ